jgi:hypothetical protein
MKSRVKGAINPAQSSEYIQLKLSTEESIGHKISAARVDKSSEIFSMQKQVKKLQGRPTSRSPQTAYTKENSKAHIQQSPENRDSETLPKQQTTRGLRIDNYSYLEVQKYLITSPTGDELLHGQKYYNEDEGRDQISEIDKILPLCTTEELTLLLRQLNKNIQTIADEISHKRSLIDYADEDYVEAAKMAFKEYAGKERQLAAQIDEAKHQMSQLEMSDTPSLQTLRGKTRHN